MPLTAPLAIWIVYASTGGDHRQTAAFAGSLFVGFLASVVFMLACWLGLGEGWSLPVVLAVAAMAWLAFVAVTALVPPARA